MISLDLAAVAVEVRAKHINRASLGAPADLNGPRRSDICTGLMIEYTNIKGGDKMKRAWNWYLKFPSDAYALGPVHFDKKEYEKPPNEADVRAYARGWEGISKLPAGFGCWPAE